VEIPQQRDAQFLWTDEATRALPDLGSSSHCSEQWKQRNKAFPKLSHKDPPARGTDGTASLGTFERQIQVS